ncbi:MAG: hypothetical protein ACQEUZ_14845 [Pseudomonadota bacterium]
MPAAPLFRRLTQAACALALLGVTACADYTLTRETQGQILGGATGAAVGSLFGAGGGQAAAIGAGAVVGAIAGGEIFKDRY